MTNQVEQLRKEIQLAKEAINIDLARVDIPYRPSAEGRRNQALNNLPLLEERLATAVLKQSNAIIVEEGTEKAGELIDFLVTNEPSTVVLDYRSLEKAFFDKMYPKKGASYSFNAEAISKLNNLLYDVSLEIEAISMPMVTGKATDYMTSTNEKDILAKISKTLDETYGGELKQIYLNRKLREAVKKTGSDSLVVLITNTPADAVSSMRMLASKSAVVAGSESSTPGAVVVEDEDSGESLVKKLIRVFNKKGSQQ